MKAQIRREKHFQKLGVKAGKRILVLQAEKRPEAMLLRYWFNHTEPKITGGSSSHNGSKDIFHDTLVIKFQARKTGEGEQ